MALEKAIDDGVKLVLEEFNRFLETRGIGRRRYIIVLKSLASGYKKWNEIKSILKEKEGKSIGNNQVSTYLNELVKYGFIEKTINGYYIPDPILRKATHSLAIKKF